jgi:hypothetical protein
MSRVFQNIDPPPPSPPGECVPPAFYSSNLSTGGPLMNFAGEITLINSISQNVIKYNFINFSNLTYFSKQNFYDPSHLFPTLP